ncbi:hypothetical protein [Streptomyces sp. NPDC007074]|uniref:hypothetical protein n=1 Tax=Streptomyces sp. NPDC007074 TaxID=3156764 RepID=UPI0033CF5309
MTIAAESFAGRVLAVFSRRSPGFRPPASNRPAASRPVSTPDTSCSRKTPQAPAQEDATGLSLADISALWNSVPPQERLRRRSDLLAAADSLNDAAPVFVFAQDLALAHARARDLELALNRYSASDLELTLHLNRISDIGQALSRDLERARELALDFDLGRDYDLGHSLGHNYNRERARELGLDYDLGVAHSLGIDNSINLGLGLNLARRPGLAHNLARARALARDLTHALRSDLDPARDRAHALARKIAHSLAREIGLDLDLDYDRTQVPADDFMKAHGTLTDAATNFLNADLATMDLVEINLAGIRWNSGTQWPTAEWTARVRRASVEDPPGSGVFVVLPEEDHDFTNLGSPAAIS